MCNIMARQSLDVALKSGLEAARHKLQTACVDMVRGSQPGGQMAPGMHGQPYGQPPMGAAAQQQQAPPALPDALQLLPLYTMALQKSIVFRGGTDIRPDDRAFAMMRLNTMPSEEVRTSGAT